MNDQPTPGDATRDPDPLDDTQRLEVPSRYAPAPEPRPDARWAWASSGGQPTGERWYEPTPAQPVSPPPAYSGGTGFGSPGAGGGGVSGWGGPPASSGDGYSVAPTPARPRTAASAGTIVAASLLSAVLAAGGTVVVLDRTGAFDPEPTAAAVAGASPVAQQNVQINESSAVIEAAARVGPAVVKITTQGQTTDPFGNLPTEGVGSGLIYDANGWILTNRHVVSDANRLTVELRDGRQFGGRVYGIDTLTDLAIVKVDEAGLPTAPIGRSDGLKVGQLVVAIGSPLGLYSFSVTSGIVSGKGREIQVDNGTRLTNLIQTDAAINPGNSGGPLVDATGAVVGVSTAVATDSSGIGFAIPIDIARPIMEQALRGEELSRPWIGVRFESITLQVKEERNLGVDSGALITSGSEDSAIVEDSPAARAGLRDGDIILALNGTRIDAEHPLDALLVQFAPGETITLDVLRDGSSVELQVTLGTRPGDL